MYSSKGISIIVCCHNSSKLLPETIKHLCSLENKNFSNLEVIVVDNNSSDATSETAAKLFEDFKCRFPFKIIDEPLTGLSHARKRGFDNSQFEYMIYCDDDNWLSSDYADLSFSIMEGDKGIAALGGSGEAVTDGTLPAWFMEFSNHYSSGKQAEEAGDITNTSGYVWGAGMVIRKNALMDLYKNGFISMLEDRTGTRLSSGGDVEICYALRLAGWKICYEPSLKFKHFIPKGKLRWDYLRKLNRGFGSQKVYFDSYLEIPRDKIIHNRKNWKSETIRMVKKLRSYGFRKLLRFMTTSEGDADTLRIEKSIGQLTQLLKLRKQYEKHQEAIRDAGWRIPAGKV